MSNTLLISVIVPVYNVEEYLPRCIESILAQKYTNFELLLIDDGSLDNSGDICDVYAAEDPRIKVFHKKNGGVSSARQLGIEEAKGKYSIHVDSDDYIAPNYLEVLYDKAVEFNADVVCCEYFAYDCLGCLTQMKYATSSEISSQKLLQDILDSKVCGALWNKLIKHNIYNRFNIKFPQDLFYSEDIYVLSKVLQNDLIVVGVNIPLYYYCFNPRSITKYPQKETHYNKILSSAKISNLLEESVFDLTTYKAKIRIEIIFALCFSRSVFLLTFPEIPKTAVKNITTMKRYIIYCLCSNVLMWYIIQALLKFKRQLQLL